MRFDNPIYDHGFVFPDIANFPDVRNEERFIDTDESDEDIKLMGETFKENNIAEFIKLYSKYNVSEKPLRKKLNDMFHFYQEFEHSRKEMDIHDSDIHQELYETGIHCTNIDTDEIVKIAQSTIDELLSQPDWNPPPGTFDRVAGSGKEIKNIVQRQFNDLGIIDAASKYNKGNRRLSVARVVIHIAKPTDSNWKQFLYDCDTVPKTTHLHIDPKEDVVKSMIYLNNVDKDSGCFSYVPKSNRYIYDRMQDIFGRAITTGSYCHTPQSRKSVFGLPSKLRVSHNFGRTLLDEDPLQKEILKREVYYDSSKGNCCIFDPAGMHRGGQCISGHRVALQVIMK